MTGTLLSNSLKRCASASFETSSLQPHHGVMAHLIRKVEDFIIAQKMSEINFLHDSDWRLFQKTLIEKSHPLPQFDHAVITGASGRLKGYKTDVRVNEAPISRLPEWQAAFLSGMNPAIHGIGQRKARNGKLPADVH